MYAKTLFQDSEIFGLFILIVFSDIDVPGAASERSNLLVSCIWNTLFTEGQVGAVFFTIQTEGLQVTKNPHFLNYVGAVLIL